MIGPFGGLNNTDSSFVIPANKAQDLLNVDVTPGGRSVKKRKGFGLSTTLTFSTSPVHGVYNFFDANGNSVDLYFNDRYLTASINGASASVVFSTGTNGATYQCVDSQGFAYCNNTVRTTLTKTNGATYSSITTVNSTGTLVAVTQERLVTSGFAEAPNRVDYSKASDFTTWTVGAQNTDPVQFTIVSPGSKLTHIVYAFNRVIWFKDSSFGYILEGATQADWQIRIISPNVGTLDNSSIYREGILYFRGQDGHIYGFDGSNYQKMTRDIQGTISASQTRRSNSWNQTALADWQASGFQPSSANFTLDGSITTKGFSQVVTSSTDWGTGSYDTTVFVDTETAPGTLQTTFPETFAAFRNGTSGTKHVWDKFCSNSTDNIAVSGGELQLNHIPNAEGNCIVRSAIRTNSIASGTTFYFEITAHTPQRYNVGYFILNTSQQTTVLASTDPANGSLLTFQWNVGVGQPIQNITPFKLKAYNQGSGTAVIDIGIGGASVPLPAVVTFFISASRINFSVVNGTTTMPGSGSTTHTWNATNVYPYFAVSSTSSFSSSIGSNIDNFTISPQTFTYTSPTFDTAISSPTWGTFTNTQTGSNGFAFTSQVSSNGSSFDAGVTATSGSPIASLRKRFLKLNAATSYDPIGFPGAVQTLSDFTVLAYSTGTLYSQVHSASSLTAWDSFTANKQDNGGSNAFFIRSATFSFATFAASPAWTSIAVGAVPTISTGTFFQIRDDISAVSTSTLASLNDFTQNWFEGSASDKSYGIYFNDALWWSVVSGTTSTTNNRVLRYDFLNADWDLYDVPTNGMLVRNNSLYFGSSTEGKIFKFGDSDSDNGSAINAYWKSKDFFGDSPFIDKEIVNLSMSATSIANSSMTVTYSLNGSSATAYTVNLYDPNRIIVRNNKNLPQGKIANTFNVKFGNNAADQPFETFAIQYGVRQKPWIPTP